MSKQGSTLQPQLQRIKIKMIIQVQSPQPVFIPQPQSCPPKNLLNIVPPKENNIYYISIVWAPQTIFCILHITQEIKKSYKEINFIIWKV